MKPPAPLPTSDKRARTRDQLLVAAQQLLVEQNAGALGIRQIALKAGLVHGSFYNYYADVPALIEDLSGLLFASHATLVAGLRSGGDDLAATFARVTRQTLRLIPDGDGYGRLLFDAGLPVDRFVSGLRAAMGADIAAGVRRGVFVADDLDVTISLVAGGILGAAVDLHRGALPAPAIEPVTARLLETLGLSAADARRLAFADVTFITPPSLPLRWQDVPAPFREALRAS
ncbi:MAG: TetR/AcrR family transcriptional regulator [Caulobacter sp.]|nr:TetR/AcrR family transcriptional regulator [Caulobacter sp.]